MGLDEVGPEVVDVVVVGAGLAGLTAALVAADRGASVAVLDGRHAGGRAAVTVVEPGVVFNGGPRALYRAGAGARVLGSLGVEARGGVAPTDGSALADGVVHRLPGSPVSLLSTRLLGTRSKLRAGALLGGLQRLEAARYDDWTLERWMADRKLAVDACELVRAVVRTGTYVDDVASFSAGSAIRQLQMTLADGVLYLDGGFQQLVDALSTRLAGAGVSVSSGEPVLQVARTGTDGPGRWTVRTATRELRCDGVVLAAGGPAAATKLSPVPIDVSGVGEPATAACLELAVRRPPKVRFLLGVGDPLYLSVHTPIAELAPRGIDVVHVLRYGTRNSDQDRTALWAHARAAGIGESDVVARRFLHRMVVMGGIPIASAGGAPGRPSVRVDGADGIFLAGDWVGPEGLLADAALASGARAGELAAATEPVAVTGSRCDLAADRTAHRAATGSVSAAARSLSG